MAFIVFEGVDGSGKTTQVALLADRVRSMMRVVVTTAEPTKGRVGRLIRDLEGTTFAKDALPLLYAADRLDHYQSVIAPALERGWMVVCDRYVLSNLVYAVARVEGPLLQCASMECPWSGDTDVGDRCPRCGSSTNLAALARGCSGEIMDIERRTESPSLTIVLSVSPEVARDRVAARGEDPLDAVALARLCGLYDRSWCLLGYAEWLEYVDANGTEAEVASRVWDAATKHIPELGQ